MSSVTPFLQMALKYRQAGLSVIPEKPRDKAPAVEWTPYQSTPATPEQINAWWGEHPDYNVGIVLGRVSRNLVALDFDATEAFSRFCTTFPQLISTRIHQTGGGGFHCLYFVKDLPASRKFSSEYGRVEVKATGTQIVAPPSIHPNGSLYVVHFKEKVLAVDDLASVVLWLTLHTPSEITPQARAYPVRRSELAQTSLSRRTEEFLKYGAPKGERNNALFRAACDMAGCGMSEDDSITQLISAASSNGFDMSFTESSALKTIRSAFRSRRIPARPVRQPSARSALTTWQRRTGR